jgi:hypothetical protein
VVPGFLGKDLRLTINKSIKQKLGVVPISNLILLLEYLISEYSLMKLTKIISFS